MKSKKVVLASTSPRRRELMKYLGVHFVCVSPKDVDETIDACDLENELMRLAVKKCKSISDIYPDSVTIGADTVVVLDNEILGKPINRAEAKAFLKRLSGKTHIVYTGVALLFPGNEEITFVEKTFVTFRDLPDDAIDYYVATGIPLDKAGAYGIQDYGALFVKEIRGDFYNVMGLPIGRIWEILRNRGYYD
ncbi:Maf family protein [Kosmotoga sp.]|uniref:Maf family protein n=1 Tax=Kosmotoga sp. TaxID=1955248 RepID=UPI00258A2E26|nr:Maf family protein [Kosmotoga sp.]